MQEDQDICQQIEDIESQLRKLRLTLEEQRKKKGITERKIQRKDNPKLVVGDKVRIVNRREGQEPEGVIVKVNNWTDRATVVTTKERKKIVRALKNLKRTSS